MATTNLSAPIWPSIESFLNCLAPDFFVTSTPADGIRLIADSPNKDEFSLSKSGRIRIGTYQVCWIEMGTKGRKSMLLEIVGLLNKKAMENAQAFGHMSLESCVEEFRALLRLPTNPHLTLAKLPRDSDGQVFEIRPTDISANWVVRIYEDPHTQNRRYSPPRQR